MANFLYWICCHSCGWYCLGFFGWSCSSMGDGIGRWNTWSSSPTVFQIALFIIAVCRCNFFVGRRNDTTSTVRHGKYQCRKCTTDFFWKKSKKRQSDLEGYGNHANGTGHFGQNVSKKCQVLFNGYSSKASTWNWFDTRTGTCSRPRRQDEIIRQT